MKQKTIDIPIFYGKLTMILDDENLSFTQNKYKTRCLKAYGAVSLSNEFRYRHYVVAFTNKNQLSTIAHEVVHLKNFIFKDCGIILDLDNDESEAYLSAFLFEKIHEFICK